MIAIDPYATPDDVRAAALALDEESARRILYDWEFWARPEQLMPAGEWRTWLLLGGRGSGKTRPAAEAAMAEPDGSPRRTDRS